MKKNNEITTTYILSNANKLTLDYKNIQNIETERSLGLN